MKTTRAPLTILFLLIALSLPAYATATEHITILHFNDLHGRVMPADSGAEPRGGAARLAALIRGISAENAKSGAATILLYGGDMFTGTIFSRAFKGEVEVAFLNDIGTNASVTGNHEFDYGLDILRQRVSETKFPVLSANIKWKNNLNAFVKEITVIPAGGVTKIGVVGLTLHEVKKRIYPAEAKDFEIDDEIKAMKHIWKELDQTSDIQLALTHDGLATDKKIAAEFPGLEAVIGGHDHIEPKDYCTAAEKTPVCQTPPYGTYLGRIDMEVDGRIARIKDVTLIPVNSTIKPDPQTQTLLDGYKTAIEKEYSKVVGRTIPIPHERNQESPLGDLVADIMRDKTRTDIALINSGGIRRSLAAGKITLKDIYEVYPFDNKVVLLELTGGELTKILDTSVGEKGQGGFLQISGLKFTIKNGRAEGIEVADAKMDPKKIYSVTTVDYVAFGGDGYIFPKSAKVTETGALLRDIITDYIIKTKELTPPTGGRILLRSE